MKRLHAFHAMLRLAWRDMRRHHARTAFSTTLIALPMAALLIGVTLMAGAPPTKARALKTIPEGAQAVVTATAVNQGAGVFAQPPEGRTEWMDDPGQQPADMGKLMRILPAEDRLLPYWNSEQLIAVGNGGLKPGKTASAKAASTGSALLKSGTGTARLCEGDAETLSMLLPRLKEGKAPESGADVVITSGLASDIGVSIGDAITLIAPPFQGFYSTNGRIAAAIQNSQHAWRVSGIVADDSTSKAWALKGWMSGMIRRDGGAGVDRHYLVVGDEPVTWNQVKVMNRLQVMTVSRHVLTDGYPGADERYPTHIDGKTMMQYLVSFVLAIGMGCALVLCLVTPAFAISADQSRRTMGLAAACGATSRDLRRMFGLQGICLGFVGGVGGVLLGAAGLLALAPPALRISIDEVPAVVPWRLLPLIVVAATLIGACATWAPSRRAGRMNVVDALRDRPDSREDGRVAGRRKAILAAPVPLLFALSIACAASSLRLGSTGGSSSDALPEDSKMPLVLLVCTMLLAVIGLVQLVRCLCLAYGVIGRAMPLALRLGLRDSAEHHRRFVPAAIAVVLTMALASYAMVLTGSAVSDSRHRSMELVQGRSHAILSAKVPVNNAIDRAVVADAIRKLGGDATFEGHGPIYALDMPDAESTANLMGKAYDDVYSRYPTARALLAASLHCKAGEYGQDLASVFDPARTPHCVESSASYANTGYYGLSMVRMDVGVTIMSPDAMRMTGFPNAEQAARTLEEGGVVVSNAATLHKDGTVTLQVNRRTRGGNGTDGETKVRQATRKATWVGGLYPLTMTERTARELGLGRFRYVGEIVALRHVHGWRTIEQLNRTVEDMPLAIVTSQQYEYEWATNADGMALTLAPIAALGLLALMAVVTSLLLSRTQSVRDMGTMHAVGASPGFLRGFGLVQALTILAPGVPLGIGAGLALGYYHIAWNRRIGNGA